MSEKTFLLIKNLVDGAELIAIGLVTYFNPALAVPINASIVILGKAIKDICEKFVKAE